MAKMTVARVKLLRNKRDVVIKQMRRDIAMLLESGQDVTARIRVSSHNMSFGHCNSLLLQFFLSLVN